MVRKISIFDLLSFCFLSMGMIVLFAFGDRETLFFINHNNSKFLDYVNVGLSGFGRSDVLIILGLLFFINPEFRNLRFLYILLGLLCLTVATSYSLKWLFDTPRPLIAIGLNHLHIVPWTEQAYHKGLPSGHTMGAFAFFTFATHLILIKSGHRLIAFLLAVGCGISRIYLAQHFLSDVLLGALIGWMIGYGMFRLYLFRK